MGTKDPKTCKHNWKTIPGGLIVCLRFCGAYQCANTLCGKAFKQPLDKPMQKYCCLECGNRERVRRHAQKGSEKKD